VIAVGPRAAPSAAAIVLGAIVLGCGGGAPLLHPAHVLHPGFVEVGAGLSGELALVPAPASPTLQELAVSPGVAPWADARVGVVGDNEAGLTYTGRSLRVDGRHAFALGGAALSVGLGASALVAHEPGRGLDPSGVFGGGLDVPVLLGIHTRSDLYALWIGPRGGFELLRGRLGIKNIGQPEEEVADVQATHAFVGGLVGFRTGFRHVHVAVEADFAYHHALGKLGGTQLVLDQLTLTPGGALEILF
jgi:hypothetical protein